MLLMFHLIEGDSIVFDEEGVEFPDLAHARQLAVRAAREILASDPLSGKLNLRRRIDVTDQVGTIDASVLFNDVVTDGSA